MLCIPIVFRLALTITVQDFIFKGCFVQLTLYLWL
jgi:hypothetical protein